LAFWLNHCHLTTYVVYEKMIITLVFKKNATISLKNRWKLLSQHRLQDF
jgi:hypothetical protein